VCSSDLARDCPVLPIDANAIDAVRLAITELSERWQATPIGGTLELEL